MNDRLKKKVIINGVIITPGEILKNRIIIIEGPVITSIVSKTPQKTGDCIEIIDASGSYIAPGFIDLHVHGGGGADTMDGTPGSLEKIAETHCSFGTTSFLPTTMTMDRDTIIKSLQNIRKVSIRGTGTSEILGIHIEGPYINPEKKGCHREEDIIKPTVEKFTELNESAGGLIKIVTIAPEVEGAIDFIKWLTGIRIIASAGHSNAKYDKVKEAVEAGLSQVTHIFNAMGGLHHREPGLAGAALSIDELYAELIADCIHVHPAVMKVMIDSKGTDKVLLITDAIRATGIDVEISELGGQKVIVKDKQARLEDETLAGSTLTMDSAVRNLVEKVGISIPDAIKMATINPARSIGVEKRKGSIEPGKDADIVLLNRDLEVDMTIAKGKIIYQA